MKCCYLHKNEIKKLKTNKLTYINSSNHLWFLGLYNHHKSIPVSYHLQGQRHHVSYLLNAHMIQGKQAYSSSSCLLILSLGVDFLRSFIWNHLSTFSGLQLKIEWSFLVLVRNPFYSSCFYFKDLWVVNHLFHLQYFSFLDLIWAPGTLLFIACISIAFCIISIRFHFKLKVRHLQRVAAYHRNCRNRTRANLLRLGNCSSNLRLVVLLRSWPARSYVYLQLGSQFWQPRCFHFSKGQRFERWFRYRQRSHLLKCSCCSPSCCWSWNRSLLIIESRRLQICYFENWRPSDSCCWSKTIYSWSKMESTWISSLSTTYEFSYFAWKCLFYWPSQRCSSNLRTLSSFLLNFELSSYRRICFVECDLSHSFNCQINHLLTSWCVRCPRCSWCLRFRLHVRISYCCWYQCPILSPSFSSSCRQAPPCS